MYRNIHFIPDVIQIFADWNVVVTDRGVRNMANKIRFFMNDDDDNFKNFGILTKKAAV